MQPGWFKQHSQRKTAVSYMTESKSLREDTKEERELSQSERILLRIWGEEEIGRGEEEKKGGGQCEGREGGEKERDRKREGKRWRTGRWW